MIIETMFLCYANEIDGYDTQRQLFLNDLPRKQDYGFNVIYYIIKKIYPKTLKKFIIIFLELYGTTNL